MQFSRIYGTDGRIDVPATGLLIGEMSTWDLRRREDIPPDKGEFVLRASFSTLTAWMFNDPDLPHRIVISIGRDPDTGQIKQYRLEPDDDARTVLDDRSLLIEGVRLAAL